MNLSIGGMALATLPPLVFALVLYALLRQRSLATFVLVFALGGLISFVLSMLLTRISTGWIDGQIAADEQATLFTVALDAMFGAALPEEAARFLVLVVVCGCFRGVRRPADIVLLGGLLGFGFAAVENAFYALTSSGVIESLMRIIPTLSHGFDGLIMAALLARAIVATRRRWLFASLALLIPVLLHFLFDFGQFSAEALGPSIENIDPDADPTPETLVVLGVALILVLSPIIVWVVEAIAAVLIVRRVRRDLRATLVTQQPIPSV